MIKLITSCLFLFLFCFTSYSQNFYYGVVLGGNAYDIEVKGNLAGGTANSELNYGLFAEYNFNNRLGVRANLISNKTTERHGYDINAGGGASRIFEKVTLNTIQFHTLIKYSLHENYKRGMYLSGGFRLTSILDEKSEKNNELLEGFYNKTNYGVLLGIGGNLLKHFNLELLADYNITNVLDSDIYKTKNIGLYLNLYINIESIISKN